MNSKSSPSGGSIVMNYITKQRK